MSTPVLHVEHITMQFGGVVAVNDLSMGVYDREIVALIGPHGSRIVAMSFWEPRSCATSLSP